jgi:sugar phosphate permease
MIWLCFALNALGYIDRANLAVAAPFIRHDLGIDDAALGAVLGSFYWSYAALQVPAGWLMDRLRLRGGLGGAVLLWSAATGATAWAGSATSLFVCRLVLGAGEGPVYPAATKLIGAWFAPRQRGIAAAILNTAPRVGTAISVPLVAALIAWSGWRASFIATGLLGIVLAFVWVLFYRAGPLEAPRASSTDALPKLAPLLWAVLRQRRFIGMTGGHFFYLFAAYFYITWFPTYLIQARHFSLGELGWLGNMPTLAAIPGTMLGGIVCDRLVRGGVPVTRARKACLGAGMMVGIFVVFIPLIADRAGMIALFSLAAAALGFTSGVTFAALAEIAPSPRVVGTITAFANGIGNLAGVCTAGFTGLVLTATHGSFDAVLVTLGIVSLLSALCFWFVVDEIAPMRLP